MATPVTPSSTPFLERIGLSEDEQKVYLALLALGPLTAGEIAKYTNVKPISKVRKILDKLYENNYAYNIVGLVDKTIGLCPFRDFAGQAEGETGQARHVGCCRDCAGTARRRSGNALFPVQQRRELRRSMGESLDTAARVSAGAVHQADA